MVIKMDVVNTSSLMITMMTLFIKMVIWRVTLYIPTMFRTMLLIKKMKKMALIKQMKMINQLMVMKMIKKLATSGRPAGSN